jgi:hypothetical protein
VTRYDVTSLADAQRMRSVRLRTVERGIMNGVGRRVMG